MTKLSIFILGLFVLGGVLFPSVPGDPPAAALEIKEGQTHPSSIIRWGDTIKIDKGACLNGSLFLVDGNLSLDGQVNEDVICISSTLEIKENADIKGDLLVLGGTVARHEKSRVAGRDIILELDLKEIEQTLVPLLFDSGSVALFKAFKILFWLVVTLIVFFIIPVKINTAESILEKNIFKIGLTGVFSLVGFALLTIMFIILSLFYVGIPLLLLLAIFYSVTYILGRTVMFYFIGIKVAERLKQKNITPAMFILFGVIIYSILKFIPYVGPFLLLIMNVFEVGIGIGFIFRKKLKFKT